jgi:hypothetical protein
MSTTTEQTTSEGKASTPSIEVSTARALAALRAKLTEALGEFKKITPNLQNRVGGAVKTILETGQLSADEERVIYEQMYSGLGLKQLKVMLPSIEMEDPQARQGTLALLNRMYVLDGKPMLFGDMTKKQGNRLVEKLKAKRKKQDGAIAAEIAELEDVLERCPHQTRQIKGQLRA